MYLIIKYYLYNKNTHSEIIVEEAANTESNIQLKTSDNEYRAIASSCLMDSAAWYRLEGNFEFQDNDLLIYIRLLPSCWSLKNTGGEKPRVI